MEKSANVIFWDECTNFGDAISPFIVKSILASDWTLVENSPEKAPSILAVGSYMHEAVEGVKVWGTGVMSPDYPITHRRSMEVHAVRGPITRAFLRQAGIDCPSVYGDPALLLPLFYKPKRVDKVAGKMGYVPHHSFSREAHEWFGSFAHVIDPLKPWREVVDEITSCSSILSTSLHGLIVSDAYGIPNAWLDKAWLKPESREWKYLDYFASQNRPVNPTFTPRLVDSDCFYNKGNRVDLQALIQSFPFPRRYN